MRPSGMSTRIPPPDWSVLGALEPRVLIVIQERAEVLAATQLAVSSVRGRTATGQSAAIARV